MLGPRCHDDGVPGYGGTDLGVMFIGVAPGREEVRNSRPYSGQAGKLLNALLRAVGVERETVYATNLICWSNPKPTELEIAACSERLSKEILENTPRLIVLLGAIPGEALAPNGVQRKGSRGVPVWDERWKAYVMSTFEPAAVLYSQSSDLVSDLLRDLAKIPTILSWPADGSAWAADVHYSTIHTPEEAQRVLDIIPADGTFVAVDIETSNLDVETIDAESDKLLRIGIGWGQGTAERVYILYPEALVGKGLRWPTSASIRWTFQYGQFDTYGISRFLGVKLSIVEDTLLLSYCRDERPGHHKLKVQAREYLGAGWYEENVARDHLETVPDKVIDAYNAKDVAYTNRLAYIHYPKVEAEGTMNVYRQLLIPGANVFRDAQEYGIKLDVDKIDALYSEWEPKQQALKDEVQDIARDEGFDGDLNLGSPLQLQKLFFRIIGLEPTRFTKKGAPSVDKYVMDSLDHPLAAKIREWRTYNVVLNLLLNYLQNCKADGRVHPQPLLHNTATGRLAYHDPPIHGTPKAYTIGADLARVAECLAATDDDYEIVVADYEQIEVWMCWAYTQDAQLLEDLLSGDVHSATAEGAFNTKRELWSAEDWQIKRQNAKKVRFGLMYGEGAEKLSTPPPLGIGGTVAECQTFVDNYWKRYSAHRRKLFDWEREAAGKGELVSAFGRKRRFPLVLDHRQLRQAINFPIQATASDYALHSAIALHPKLLAIGAHILMSWHDALVIEYPRKLRSTILPLVKREMESEKVEGFPSVRVEMKVGPNLGSVKKVEVKV